MRKNKTWEITLTNNDRLVANEPIENAVVYTTDTEAYLNFRVIDSGFEFDGATIAMLNKDDGSIVERPMVKEDDTAVYEIESDIIPHFGLWQAQVLFKQGDEIFTSTPVTFVIERYMMAEQPPRLEDVTNWKDLYENATETINELNQINDDLNATKQIVEQAETQRATAESSRASAEAQREIDHANRSAEMDGKADKVVLRNLNDNGDFSDDLTNWKGNTGVVLEKIPDGLNLNTDSVTARYFSADNIVVTKEIKSGDMIYSIFSGTINYTTPYRITIELRGSSIVNILTFDSTKLINDFTYSGIYKINDNISVSSIRYLYATLYGGEMVGTNTIRNVNTINLTQTFGAGNEPTKDEMDRLIEFTGYIDGEYALNNKEMLGYLIKGISEKANKKQEDWITPTLSNGWEAESGIAYMKDEFGFVHLKGRIKNGLKGQSAFSLPVGYRPKDRYNGFLIPVDTTSTTVLSITSTGTVIPTETSNVWIDLISVKFRAEG